MPFVLPVPSPVDAHPETPAPVWETAAPNVDGPQINREGRVTRVSGLNRYANARDEWMGVDLAVIPRQGVMNGRQLFDENVWQPPNEGHGEYNFAQDGPKIDHSVVNFAIFWSDWYGSTTRGASAAGSFTGEHVVIARVPPGSTQGYMPTETAQPNNERNQPGPWDQQIAVGRQQFLDRMRAATSM